MNKSCDKREYPAQSWLLLALSALLTAFRPGELAEGRSEVRPRTTSNPECIQIRTESRSKESGYDHWVFITNRCDSTAACDVSTSVSKVSLTVIVNPGRTEDVLTFKDAAESEFRPYVTCHLQRTPVD